MSWNIRSFPQSSFSQEEKTLTQLSQEWQQKPSSASLLSQQSSGPVVLPLISLAQDCPSNKAIPLCSPSYPKHVRKLHLPSLPPCHATAHTHLDGWLLCWLSQPWSRPSATLQTDWWLLFWQKPSISHTPDTDNSRHPYSLKSNFTLLLPWIMFAEMHKRNIVPLFMYLSLHRSQYCNRDPYSHLIKLLSNNDYKHLHTRILKCSAYEKAMYLKKLCI